MAKIVRQESAKEDRFDSTEAVAIVLIMCSYDHEEYILLRLPPKVAESVHEAMRTNELKDRLTINMHGLLSRSLHSAN